MKQRNTRWQWALGMLCFLSTPAFALSHGVGGLKIRVEPDVIEIGMFYDAPPLKVSAEIPDGCDAVIEILGKEIEEQLLRKGRHWDIWMSVGEIDIDGAHSVYYAMSSDPESLAVDAPNPAFGYGVLERQASFIGDKEGLQHLVIFDEFVKLKEREKLYRVYPGELEISQSPDGSTLARGKFVIPSRIAPDTYQVRLSVLRDGRLVDARTVPLEVRVVGLPALLSSLARRHGGLYGLLAVAVAAVFGYFTGVVFKRKKPGSQEDNQVKAVAERKEGG